MEGPVTQVEPILGLLESVAACGEAQARDFAGKLYPARNTQGVPAVWLGCVCQEWILAKYHRAPRHHDLLFSSFSG